ncbi:hypothetical protein [Ruegeria sp. HKCCD8929]|uniref:hypothetical protein n=1 Tax=Ruegeria sp. HKCCD8929 TaxID=2683006 RepID=UPI0014896E99|nr:hypothetical protein [Ruegeria sp. HKCCD8929]
MINKIGMAAMHHGFAKLLHRFRDKKPVRRNIPLTAGVDTGVAGRAVLRAVAKPKADT